MTGCRSPAARPRDRNGDGPRCRCRNNSAPHPPPPRAIAPLRGTGAGCCRLSPANIHPCCRCFGMQLLGAHMPVFAGKQQLGQGDALPCGPQAGHPQHGREARPARWNRFGREAAVRHGVGLPLEWNAKLDCDHITFGREPHKLRLLTHRNPCRAVPLCLTLTGPITTNSPRPVRRPIGSMTERKNAYGYDGPHPERKG